MKKPPKELDAIADVVLNYRPKSKQKKPRKRKRRKQYELERIVRKART